MSNNYASMHIFQVDDEKKMKIINYYYATNSLIYKLDNLTDNNQLLTGTKRILELFDGVHYRHLFNILSIYDESSGFQSIKDESKEISSRFESTIFYISNFDNCVFICGLIDKGKLITEIILGNNLKEFGLRYKKGDFNRIVQKLQIEISANRLNNINNQIINNNISFIETEISDLINISPINR